MKRRNGRAIKPSLSAVGQALGGSPTGLGTPRELELQKLSCLLARQDSAGRQRGSLSRGCQVKSGRALKDGYHLRGANKSFTDVAIIRAEPRSPWPIGNI